MKVKLGYIVKCVLLSLPFCVACSLSPGGDSSSNLAFLLGLAALPPNDQALSNAITQAGVTPLDSPPPQNAALVTLGKALFFDKELSGDRNISCSTCHLKGGGTTDALPASIGWGGNGLGSNRTVGTGNVVGRNAPPLFNLGAQVKKYFWDGRVSRADSTGVLTTPEPALNGSSPTRADIAVLLTSGLAAQAMFPVTSDVEMRGAPGNAIRNAANNQAVWAAIMARLVGTSNGTVGGIANYRALFSAAFPTVGNFNNFNFGHAAQAIAAFELASYSSIDSPFEKYVRGDKFALTSDQKAGGLIFFGKGNCSTCHRGPQLSDMDFHGAGAPQVLGSVSGYQGTGDDRGRQLISGNPNDAYTFRTPSLHNVELTGPYTHSGAYATLTQVVQHYEDPALALATYSGQGLRSDFLLTVDNNAFNKDQRRVAIDPVLRRKLNLNEFEKLQLVAFLQCLTDPAARSISTAPASVPSGLSIDQ